MFLVFFVLTLQFCISFFFSIYSPKTQQHIFDLIMTFANVETSSFFLAILDLKMFLRNILLQFFIVKCFSQPLLLIKFNALN